MITNGPHAWPENVAFKRLVRDLWRKRDYVPPYQQPSPTLAPAPALLSSTTDAPEATGVRIGGWVLDVNEQGDLMARHDNGQTQVLALLTEGTDTDG